MFVQTKGGVDALEDFLYREGFPVGSIHGDRIQSERERALADFRSGRVPILVATEIAARGLDIPHVLHVINYDMPPHIEEYIHRIGRTGRAGNSGLATAFLTDSNVGVVGDLIDTLRKSEQEVPDWLEDMARHGHHSRGKRGGSYGGGRDFRRDHRTNGLASPYGSSRDEWGLDNPSMHGGGHYGGSRRGW